jgi:hypothetical protein
MPLVAWQPIGANLSGPKVQCYEADQQPFNLQQRDSLFCLFHFFPLACQFLLPEWYSCMLFRWKWVSVSKVGPGCHTSTPSRMRTKWGGGGWSTPVSLCMTYVYNVGFFLHLSVETVKNLVGRMMVEVRKYWARESVLVLLFRSVLGWLMGRK